MIDLTAAEIARLLRLLHLADDPADVELWEKLEAVHVAGFEPAPTTGQTAADEYDGDSAEVRNFLGAFEV